MAEIAFSAAQFSIEDVLSLLHREVHCQKDVYNEVPRLKSDLESIQAFIKDMDGIAESELSKDRIRKAREIAYDIEDALDMFNRQVTPKFHRHNISKVVHNFFDYFPRRINLHEISTRVKDIKRAMDNSNNPIPYGARFNSEGSSSEARVEDHRIHHIPKEDEIMGFEEHKKALIDRLVEGDSRFMKIWVVGLGGFGKSILVKTVYESKRIFGKYDCHAWIHVDRTFKSDELLSNMLKQFREGRDKSMSSSEEDVKAELLKYLQAKRYVLVLDDIWSKVDYETIVKALPDDSPGSRIIVTTRNFNVASSCESSSENILELKGLHWPNAWNLFCKKAFPRSDGLCPKELEGLSQLILKKCEGWPLAIAAVGSLLATKRPHPSEWMKLHDSLGSEIHSDNSLGIISRILLPSYMDLSITLKSCLLYFSIFPVDYSIKRGRLIRLWIAEGFVRDRGGKTLEEAAEDYLNELIGRNLVHVSAKDFDGRVNSCRVLNFVREFILLKSKEENFVTVLTEPSASSLDKIRRLSFSHSSTSLSNFKALDYVRTLFMFEWGDSKMGTLLGHSKLLRVLDLQGASSEDFPKENFELTLLRYLSLRETKIKMVPESVKKLAFLETLDLRHTYVTKLPSGILGLKFLRHLLVYRYDVKKYVTFKSAQGVEVPEGIGDLSSIQKLSLIKAARHCGVVKELKKMIQLRKLGLIDLKREDGKELCESIQKMERLLTLDVRSTCQDEYIEMDEMDNPPRLLQRLFLKGRLHKIPMWTTSLDSLVRIGLRWSRLKTSPLETLQDLPHLVELEMVDSYTGELLEFKAKKFKKLKILHLEQFEELNTVTVEREAMPELAKLTICKCEKLEMPPLGISDLNQLEELLLYDMNQTFIAKLQKDGEYRYMVDHVRIIHSFTLNSSQFWSLQNLS